MHRTNLRIGTPYILMRLKDTFVTRTRAFSLRFPDPSVCLSLLPYAWCSNERLAALTGGKRAKTSLHRLSVTTAGAWATGSGSFGCHRPSPCCCFTFFSTPKRGTLCPSSSSNSSSSREPLSEGRGASKRRRLREPREGKGQGWERLGAK